MNMKNLILFLLLAVTAKAQTIKDGSIVARMISNDLITQTGSGIGYSLVTSVNANAFTVTLKSHDNSSLSALKPAVFFIRDSDGTTGKTLHYKQSSDLSITIPSGTTLGTTNGVQGRFWVYILNNSGTLELALTHGSVFNCTGLATTSAISGGATVGQIYSTTARTDKPCALIGYFEATQATAGTWATNATRVLTRNFSTYVEPTITLLTSGTSATYTTPKNVKHLIVTAIGGGGGGSGSGLDSGGGGSGGSGGQTSFGGLITANGGYGGSWTSHGAGGGSIGTVTAPAKQIYRVAGSGGGSSQFSIANNVGLSGGFGGVSCLGGGAVTVYNAATGGTAQGNSGSGGAGGGGVITASPQHAGTGGGSGGCTKAIIQNGSGSLAATYTYTVGTAGTAGTAGTSGAAGGAGAAGVIIVEEYYQ